MNFKSEFLESKFGNALQLPRKREGTGEQEKGGGAGNKTYGPLPLDQAPSRLRCTRKVRIERVVSRV